MSIFTPNNIQELQDQAMLLCGGNQRDALALIQIFAAFGHHFGGDLGRTWTQGYNLRGKPTLNADAMAGICRSSGLVRYIKIVSWDEQHCQMSAARRDEPDHVEHVFEFTFQMANAQGLTNNRNWKTMPMQMLRARCLTMLLRAVFPDAVSGIYSVDEIADNTNMDDTERAQLTAQSLGEDYSAPPQPYRAPKPTSRPPQPIPPQPVPPQHQSLPVAPIEPIEPVEPHAKRGPTPVKNFESLADLEQAMRHHGITRGEVNEVARRLDVKLVDMSPEQLGSFFYSWLISETLRKSKHVKDWWRDMGNAKTTVKKLREEFPCLPLEADSRTIGQNLTNVYFWEGLSVSRHLTGELVETGRALMKQIIDGSQDINLLAQLSRL